MDILWLRPDKPENISIGRHRIADILEARGHEVEVRNTTTVDFIRLLRRTPDVIIGTTRLGAFVGAWHKLVKGTPLVVDHIDPIAQMQRNHDLFITRMVDLIERFAFRISDYALVVYEEEYDRVARYAPQTVKTSLGVDYDRFANPSKEAIEEASQILQPDINASDSILIYIGGLEPAYHIRELVEAMEHLEGWELVLLGDGSEREFVEAATDTRDNVSYLGTVPYETIPGFLHEANVGISLIDDPNTLKVLEYGAAGLPVVHIQGSGERRFGDAVTFCSTRPKEIANAVKEGKSADANALRRLANQHQWETIADDYEDAIQDVVYRG